MKECIKHLVFNYLKFFTIMLASVHFAQAKVEPPNYNFSLDVLGDFYPGKKLNDLEKKYGKGIELSNSKYKFQVSHIRYKFPVIIQIKNGEIFDMYATLPTYFLHDIFHQSLINRYKKQDTYKKVKEQAVYIWNDIAGNRIVYSGACTITCFPVYYTVHRNGPNYTPLIDQLNQMPDLEQLNTFTAQ